MSEEIRGDQLTVAGTGFVGAELRVVVPGRVFAVFDVQDWFSLLGGPVSMFRGQVLVELGFRRRRGLFFTFRERRICPGTRGIRCEQEALHEKGFRHLIVEKMQKAETLEKLATCRMLEEGLLSSSALRQLLASYTMAIRLGERSIHTERAT